MPDPAEKPTKPTRDIKVQLLLLLGAIIILGASVWSKRDALFPPETLPPTSIIPKAHDYDEDAEKVKRVLAGVIADANRKEEESGKLAALSASELIKHEFEVMNALAGQLELVAKTQEYEEHQRIILEGTAAWGSILKRKRKLPMAELAVASQQNDKEGEATLERLYKAQAQLSGAPGGQFTLMIIQRLLGDMTGIKARKSADNIGGALQKHRSPKEGGRGPTKQLVLPDKTEWVTPDGEAAADKKVPPTP